MMRPSRARTSSTRPRLPSFAIESFSPCLRFAHWATRSTLEATSLVGARPCPVVGQAVERVLGSGGAGFGAGADDIALGGGHGLVTEEFHERVDADVGVSQFGGVSVP
jgi:hypothetical protein